MRLTASTHLTVPNATGELPRARIPGANYFVCTSRPTENGKQRQ